ncbi:MAG: hypothetical protein HFJ55_05560 [Clostridia bacterium]|nr:hypothetical protein [Clostridia bacterium]
MIPYWVNTSSNDLIKLILKKSATVKEKMERLLKDEAIEVKVDQETVNLVEKIYKVKIPNKEIKEFEKKFRILVMQMFSYMDVKENTAENFYHAFVLGMLVGLKDSYYVNSNRESGIGRYDIMLEPKDKNGNAFIMEFKVLEDLEEKTIEETIENAKTQIEEKKYEENLRERGYSNITKLVFAFNGKEVKTENY